MYNIYKHIQTTQIRIQHYLYTCVSTQESKKEICEKGFKHEDGESDKVHRVSIADLEKLLK